MTGRIALAAALVILLYVGTTAASPGGGGGDGLSLAAAPTTGDEQALLDGDPAAWTGAPETTLLLQRTPPIYPSDPPDDGYRPTARAAALWKGGRMWVRLRWTDPTDSDPSAPGRVPDVGDSSIYKEHSLDVERFADAACVMVPREAGPRAAYPAIMMGDAADPVDLYYWNHRRGFERLSAAGRATVSGFGSVFPGSVRRQSDGWEIVVEVPAVPTGTPVAFAVWDGDRGQRSGLKYYSLWIEVVR